MLTHTSSILFLPSLRATSPPSPLPPPQECVRFHTINRATGRARIWEVGLTFYTQLTANAFDTDGAPMPWGEIRSLSHPRALPSFFTRRWQMDG